MNFAILLFPQVEELDFAGPWEMLTMWKQIADGPRNCLLVAQTLEPVVCAKGLSVNPHVFGPYARSRMDAAVASVGWDVALSNDIPGIGRIKNWRRRAPCAQARSCRNAAARPGRRQVWWSLSRQRCSSTTGRSGLLERARSLSTRSSQAG
ncbi:MAG: thiamine biosynthesis protein ThiJ [Ramlibacter sp.]|jgi:hypothetical protein|nr:thiamine biosynthesis protein ThiJ [Ramlibacter sp.]